MNNELPMQSQFKRIKDMIKKVKLTNGESAYSLYEKLSTEFVRKGIASNRFSELNELYSLADIGEESLKQIESMQSELDKRDAIIARASTVISALVDDEDMGPLDGLTAIDRGVIFLEELKGVKDE